MTTEWYGDEMLETMKQRAAEGLLAAAVLYSNQLRLRVSTPSPFYTVNRSRNTVAGKTGSTYRVYYDPSKPGEYPKLRTGAGQKAITCQPASVAEVMRTGYVRVGYVYGNHHLLSLEMNQDRKGLIDLLDEMRPQLAALATGSFRSS